MTEITKPADRDAHMTDTKTIPLGVFVRVMVRLWLITADSDEAGQAFQ